MKDIVEQLARYKSVHLNKTNIQTHFVGVPLIILGVTCLMNTVTFSMENPYFSLDGSAAMVVSGLAACYYLFLHRLLALAMMCYLVVNLLIADFFASTEHYVFMGVTLFVLGWIIQFVGHHYEKAKPAFVDDLSQLAIGPLFLMAETYFALGFEKALEEKISPIALQKRRKLTANLKEQMIK